MTRSPPIISLCGATPSKPGSRPPSTAPYSETPLTPICSHRHRVHARPLETLPQWPSVQKRPKQMFCLHSRPLNTSALTGLMLSTSHRFLHEMSTTTMNGRQSLSTRISSHLAWQGSIRSSSLIDRSKLVSTLTT
ncbi:hypothetical protein BKA56DRAFT_597199 [Ilyonectria sp. MPI-CAGE-AT-0026]|nr:hypothetical protein BKA56DRAFT_597199 [Ilyonectria sp. MPI-CAGE-AT-0026]